MLKTSYQKLARLFYAVFTITNTSAITFSEKMYAQREEMKVSMSVEDFLYITKQERTRRDSAKFSSLNLIFNEFRLSWTCCRLFKSSQQYLLEMFGRFCGSLPIANTLGTRGFFSSATRTFVDLRPKTRVATPREKLRVTFWDLTETGNCSWKVSDTQGT